MLDSEFTRVIAKHMSRDKKRLWKWEN